MLVSVRPKHQQQEDACLSLRHDRSRAAQVDGVAALPPPPPPGPLGKFDLSRRRMSYQGKRSTITHVACQPCQRRKHKCDGKRPACTPCRAKKRSDCAYDANGDQRRTTALKTRIQDLTRHVEDLTKQVEDMKDIVRGIAATPDQEVALATARQLVAEGFARAADVANIFKEEQTRETQASEGLHRIDRTIVKDETVMNVPTALCSYAPLSNGAVAEAAFYNDTGGISFSQGSMHPQLDSLRRIQSYFQNTPIMLPSCSQRLDDQTFHHFQPIVGLGQENEYEAMADPMPLVQGSKFRQAGYENASATEGGSLQMLGMVHSDAYWYPTPSQP